MSNKHITCTKCGTNFVVDPAINGTLTCPTCGTMNAKMPNSTLKTAATVATGAAIGSAIGGIISDYSESKRQEKINEERQRQIKKIKKEVGKEQKIIERENERQNLIQKNLDASRKRSDEEYDKLKLHKDRYATDPDYKERLDKLNAKRKRFDEDPLEDTFKRSDEVVEKIAEKYTELIRLAGEKMENPEYSIVANSFLELHYKWEKEVYNKLKKPLIESDKVQKKLDKQLNKKKPNSMIDIQLKSQLRSIKTDAVAGVGRCFYYYRNRMPGGMLTSKKEKKYFKKEKPKKDWQIFSESIIDEIKEIIDKVCEDFIVYKSPGISLVF